MFVVETLIAGRFRTLNGKHGGRWSTLMFCLFPALFCLGFVHPMLWAASTLALEVYILITLCKELRGRTRSIREHQAEGVRLARAADAAASA